ncbi:MAG: F0F1 ATP synthase subunit epsilon [Acidimicrobiales bacterium]
MADGLFQVIVVTPEERLVDVTAREVVLRSSDGDLTVLDGHTPLVTDVVPGEVRVVPDGEAPIRLAVHGGYLHVVTGPGAGSGSGDVAVPPGGGAVGERATQVTLLAGVAELAGQIDLARAEQAKARAQERVEAARGAPGGGDGEGADGGPSIELADAEAALRRAEVRLAVGTDGGGR